MMKLVRWALVVTAVGVVATAVILFAGVETVVSSRTVAILCGLAMLALLPVLAGRQRLPADPLLGAAALLAAAALITYPWSIQRHMTLQWASLLIAYAALYGLLAHVTPGPKAARTLLQALVAVAFLTAGYGLWTTLTGREVVLWLTKTAYRDSLTGTFINRNHFASYLALNMLVAIGFLAAMTSRWRRLLYLPLAAAGLALLLTLSRGGLLAAAIAATMFLLLIAGDRRRLVLPLAAIAAVAVAGLLATNVGRLQDRIESSFSADGEPSAAARLSMWRSALRAFGDAPILGHGAGTFESFYPTYREPAIARKVTYAHQDYLELLAEQGLIGAAVLAFAGLVLIAMLRRRLDDESTRPLAAGIASGLLVVAVHAGVDFPLKIPAIALVTAALIGLAAAQRKTRDGTLEQRTSRAIALVAVAVLAITAERGLRVARAERHLERGNALFNPPWLDAGREFQAAIDLVPDNPEAWEGLAHTELNRAKFQWRGQGMEARMALAEQALAHFSEAERRDPKNGAYNLQLAWTLNFLQRHDEALVEYDRAVADDPANANVLFHAGSFHLHNGDRARGLDLIARGLRSWPRFFGGKIGEIHHLVGDYRLVLEVIPRSEPFLVFQYAAHLLARADDPDAARVAAARAFADGGWDPGWIQQWAGLLAQHQSPTAALAFYDEVPASARTAGHTMQRAQIEIGSGRSEAARQTLRAGSIDHPCDRDILRFVISIGDDDPAIDAALARYAAACGEDAGYLLAVGTRDLLAQRLEDALTAFEAALALEPDEIHARRGAARVHRKLARRAGAGGDADRARRHDELAEELDPGVPAEP